MTQAPHGDVDPDEAGSEIGLGFTPANELESILGRCLLTGARATLLRALARSAVCVLADPRALGSLSGADSGGLQVPCVADAGGRHALVYTSYRQMRIAHQLGEDAAWVEVPAGNLFATWPPDVDVWLNAGGELGLPLDRADIAAVADIAAGLEVNEAYEIGPDDTFTDFPGPSIPDEVDCAVVLTLFDVPEVLEVVRVFRRLDEPAGRTWRILLVLVDADVRQSALAERVVTAVNDASDECCEVHVADVHDDEVYDAVAHLLRLGVALWRRQGLMVPDTLAGLDEPGDNGSEAGPDAPGEEPA